MENKKSIAQQMLKIFIPVGFIGLIIAGTMWYSMHSASTVAKKYAPLIDAIMEIKLETTSAHLWFEEIISGDSNEDIEVVWNLLDKAEWYAQAMLDGGVNDEGTYIALKDEDFRHKIREVIEKINAFRLIAKERLDSIEKSSVGSEIDQSFDELFADFLLNADILETNLQLIMNNEIDHFQTVQSSLIIICLILTALIGILLSRYERRQMINLSVLDLSNQQLSANEQQLKAANQQLKAGEQQLKASNQQLRAGEQQLKAINQELLQSQQKLSLHVEQTPLAVIQWDLDFKVTEWNSAAEKIFGYSYEEALGKHSAGLIVPESAKNIVNEVWTGLLSQKGGTRSTNDNLTKNKETITCEWYNTPLIDENGKVVAVASLVLDITETKRLRELESRADRLKMAGTIAGQVAHDFNNLLSPIMAYPDLISDELPHDHTARAYLEDIKNAAIKITNINQDLLTMGRRGHYNQEVLNLNQIILQASKELEMRSKTIVWEKKLSEDLLNISGGGAQLHRMFTNLLINAIDSMQDIGTVTIKTENYYADDTSIAFDCVPKGEYVKVTISDTGCGIPDNIIEKIIDPFFSTKTSDKKRGSGLGLSVVDSVIKDHKGFLDLNSKVGHGTSFYIYFPIVRKDIRKSESHDALNGSEKILIVDDDEIQLIVVRTLLEKLGYEVSVVESGEKAVEFLKNNSQDLVILDMVMPGGIDGTETYRRILEFRPKQKTIILSGFSETDRVFEVQRMGAGAFVRKPITKDIIASAVRTELSR